YAGVLCPWGELTNIPISPELRDIPVSVPYSGSYGFLMYFNDNGSGATARFGRAPGDNSIRSVSGSVSDFLEFMIQPIEGDRRYNLGLSSTTNKTVTSVRMFQLSQGIKKDPYPLVVGEDRKSTRLNSSHVKISYAVFCLKKKKTNKKHTQ